MYAESERNLKCGTIKWKGSNNPLQNQQTVVTLNNERIKGNIKRHSKDWWY
jgi:hypothetical protein